MGGEISHSTNELHYFLNLPLTFLYFGQKDIANSNKITIFPFYHTEPFWKGGKSPLYVYERNSVQSFS